MMCQPDPRGSLNVQGFNLFEKNLVKEEISAPSHVHVRCEHTKVCLDKIGQEPIQENMMCQPDPHGSLNVQGFNLFEKNLVEEEIVLGVETILA